MSTSSIQFSRTFILLVVVVVVFEGGGVVRCEGESIDGSGGRGRGVVVAV